MDENQEIQRNGKVSKMTKYVIAACLVIIIILSFTLYFVWIGK